MSAVPRGGNLTYNGDLRVEKLTFENLKMSNFPWVARLSILGQTIDRRITSTQKMWPLKPESIVIKGALTA